MAIVPSSVDCIIILCVGVSSHVVMLSFSSQRGSQARARAGGRGGAGGIPRNKLQKEAWVRAAVQRCGRGTGVGDQRLHLGLLCGQPVVKGVGESHVSCAW